jgi:hypothetical protein
MNIGSDVASSPTIPMLVPSAQIAWPVTTPTAVAAPAGHPPS